MCYVYGCVWQFGVWRGPLDSCTWLFCPQSLLFPSQRKGPIDLNFKRREQTFCLLLKLHTLTAETGRLIKLGWMPECSKGKTPDHESLSHQAAEWMNKCWQGAALSYDNCSHLICACSFVVFNMLQSQEAAEHSGEESRLWALLRLVSVTLSSCITSLSLSFLQLTSSSQGYPKDYRK